MGERKSTTYSQKQQQQQNNKRRECHRKSESRQGKAAMQRYESKKPNRRNQRLLENCSYGIQSMKLMKLKAMRKTENERNSKRKLLKEKKQRKGERGKGGGERETNITTTIKKNVTAPKRMIVVVDDDVQLHCRKRSTVS